MGSDPQSPTQFWKAYPTIPAVKNHRVLGYAEDPTLHPGPRVGATLVMIAKLIHPEAWKISQRMLPRTPKAQVGSISTLSRARISRAAG
jgi:hypothetical protein